LFPVGKATRRGCEFRQHGNDSFQLRDFRQWLRLIFQARISVGDAPYGQVAHSFGLMGELRIDRQRSRGEIGQIIRAAEWFAGEHEQCLEQFFGGLLDMYALAPGRARRAAAIATSGFSSTIASHRLASTRFSG
jgi:hypothetical protein